MQNEISFGSHPSLEDKRTVTGEMLDMAAALPPENNRVMLDFDCCNDLCNQKKLGICTKCAVRMATEQSFAVTRAVENVKKSQRLSENWGYLIGKINIDGNFMEGSSALTMLKSANKYGIPLKEIENDFPLYTTGTYDEYIQDFKQRYGGKIPQAVLDSAALNKIKGYAQIKVDPVSIARELAKDRLVIARFTVGDNTYKDANGNITWQPEGLFPLRAPKIIEGGHLWVIDENVGLAEDCTMWGTNSWSKAWGLAGRFYFNFKTQKPYFTEAWVITDVPAKLLEELKKNDFKVDLKFGMKHPDVKRLQQFLNAQGFTVALQGAGSNGNETDYFGGLTKQAVAKFQLAHNIHPAAGFFGPITRGIVNGLK